MIKWITIIKVVVLPILSIFLLAGNVGAYNPPPALLEIATDRNTKSMTSPANAPDFQSSRFVTLSTYLILAHYKAVVLPLISFIPVVVSRIATHPC
ncbi:MAG: hypothetical protein J5U19_07320 [Candidatus Methanoperedens sp.]|nr:hypothetical protein [Candidatus Methanoperedens sp.]